MKRLLFYPVYLILFLFQQDSYAWNIQDHQRLTEAALHAVADDWGLNHPYEIRPLSAFLKKLAQIRPGIRLADYLRINPQIDLEAVEKSLRGKTRITPIEILSVYSRDPDDGRDQDLFLRDQKGNLHYAYPDQKWFGALSGANSQAFRHMEKPPFRWRHCISTFGFPFRAVGEATSRAEIYFEVAELAFALHENYWGWRFLANALHYVEDLHQPYHTGQITPHLLAQGLKAYFQWGRKSAGFLGTFSHLLSNSHRLYESFVENPRGYDRGIKGEALEEARGEDAPPISGTIKEFAVGIRDSSNLLFSKLIEKVTEATTPELLGPRRFISDDAGADDPAHFLKTGSEFETAYREIFLITKNRFEAAGRAIRSLVQTAIERKGTRSPQEILQRLDVLLNPPHHKAGGEN